MSSTDAPEPEPVEAIPGGGAWFHNKAAAWFGLTAAASLTLVIFFGFGSGPEPPAQLRPPPGELQTPSVGHVADADITTADDLVADPMTSGTLLESDIETPAEPEPEPRPPPMLQAGLQPEADRLKALTGAGASITAEADVYRTGAPLAPDAVSEQAARIAQARLDMMYDAVLAGTALPNASPPHPEDAGHASNSTAPAAESNRRVHAVASGTVIHAVIERAVRSDAPGPIVAIVARPVLDTPEGTRTVVPKGATLVGAKTGTRWNRIDGLWHTLRMPDGAEHAISAVLNARDGSGGVPGKLVTGAWRRLGLGAAQAFVSAGSAAASSTDDRRFLPLALPDGVGSGADADPDADPGGDGGTPRLNETHRTAYREVLTPGQAAARSIGESAEQMAGREIDAMERRQISYVEVPGGERVLAILVEPLDL